MDITRIARPTEYALLGRGPLAQSATKASMDAQLIASLKVPAPQPAASPGKGTRLDVSA
ncbi:MAG: hypothetical protein MUF40_07855 [Gemmatimonadaceae bacterium]|jgi:hypothetical protein|nr:hypothetical protein [Gemmatimonadaceae bacterium]